LENKPVCRWGWRWKAWAESVAAAYTLRIGATPGRAFSVLVHEEEETYDIDLGSWKDTAAVLQNLATIVALFLGSLWTYFHFVRGRTYTPRLELDVEGTVVGSPILTSSSRDASADEG
jgi:hypothetical protein